MTTAAASAALPQPPEVRPERIAWMDVEDVPEMVEFTDGLDRPIGWAPITPAGLTDKMADKFREVCDLVDSASCEANGCVNSPDQRVGVPLTGGPIGWVLAGEADERTEWRGVTLVQHGQKVIAVCEGCSPSNVYDPLFANPEE